MKINFIGVNRLRSGSNRVNMALEKVKPGKPVSPPQPSAYLILDVGRLDINKLK